MSSQLASIELALAANALTLEGQLAVAPSFELVQCRCLPVFLHSVEQVFDTAVPRSSMAPEQVSGREVSSSSLQKHNPKHKMSQMGALHSGSTHSPAPLSQQIEL